MEIKDMLSKAHKQGCSVGELALAEFILKSYAGEISPTLKAFLEKIAQSGYVDISENVGKPAEDVALQVSDILNKVVK